MAMIHSSLTCCLGLGSWYPEALVILWSPKPMFSSHQQSRRSLGFPMNSSEYFKRSIGGGHRTQGGIEACNKSNKLLRDPGSMSFVSFFSWCFFFRDFVGVDPLEFMGISIQSHHIMSESEYTTIYILYIITYQNYMIYVSSWLNT